MPVKHHPMWLAKAGTVFCITFEPGKWGFVRFYRGLSMAILSVYGTTPQLPRVDWENPPVGWIFFSFAPDADRTEALSLGAVPFENSVAEWAPPCYTPPDIIERYYTIHEKGGVRQGTEESVRGMKECRTVTPAQLAEFLRERLKAGELTPLCE